MNMDRIDENDGLQEAVNSLPPPPDFDPITASESELLTYSFPRRPPDGHPELLTKRTRMVSSPQIPVEPQFGKLPTRPYESLVPERTEKIWSGSVTWAANGDSVTSVQGEWTVPHIVAPGQDDCYVCQWVGIQDPEVGGLAQGGLLQAGTYTQIKAGVLETLAFVEWWPALGD